MIFWFFSNTIYLSESNNQIQLIQVIALKKYINSIKKKKLKIKIFFQTNNSISVELLKYNV